MKLAAKFMADLPNAKPLLLLKQYSYKSPSTGGVISKQAHNRAAALERLTALLKRDQIFLLDIRDEVFVCYIASGILYWTTPKYFKSAISGIDTIAYNALLGMLTRYAYPQNDKFTMLKINDEWRIELIKGRYRIVNDVIAPDDVDRLLTYILAPRTHIKIPYTDRKSLRYNEVLRSIATSVGAHKADGEYVVAQSQVQTVLDYLTSPVLAVFNPDLLLDRIYYFYGQSGSGKTTIAVLSEMLWGTLLTSYHDFRQGVIYETSKDRAQLTFPGFILEEYNFKKNSDAAMFFSRLKHWSSQTRVQIKGIRSSDSYDDIDIHHNPACLLISNHKAKFPEVMKEAQRRIHAVEFRHFDLGGCPKPYMRNFRSFTLKRRKAVTNFAMALVHRAVDILNGKMQLTQRNVTLYRNILRHKKGICRNLNRKLFPTGDVITFDIRRCHNTFQVFSPPARRTK